MTSAPAHRPKPLGTCPGEPVKREKKGFSGHHKYTMLLFSDGAAASIANGTGAGAVCLVGTNGRWCSGGRLICSEKLLPACFFCNGHYQNHVKI